MKINFTLNGSPRQVECAPDRRVVDLLREDLGMTGTKEACGAGECGACTVLVDGETRLSCLTLAAQLADRQVVTIEGLAGVEGGPHPVQRALAEAHAVQCGFCTPGMALATLALLNRNQAPSRLEIREGLSGNLCRCTGYAKIVDAVELAAARRREGEPWPK